MAHAMWTDAGMRRFLWDDVVGLGMTFERRGLLNGLDTVFYRIGAREWRERRHRDALGTVAPG